MAAHLFEEGRTGTVAGLALTAGPSAIFPLHGTTENAQHGGGHRVTHTAAIRTRTDIQAEMRGPGQALAWCVLEVAEQRLTSAVSTGSLWHIIGVAVWTTGNAAVTAKAFMMVSVS